MKLRELRLSTGLTQAETAKKLNMPRTKYARYELETAEPNIQTIIQFAQYFHTTVDNLLGHEVPYLLDKSILTAKQKAIVDLLPDMNDRICEKAEAYINGLLEGENDKIAAIQKFKN